MGGSKSTHGHGRALTMAALAVVGLVYVGCGSLSSSGTSGTGTGTGTHVGGTTATLTGTVFGTGGGADTDVHQATGTGGDSGTDKQATTDTSTATGTDAVYAGGCASICPQICAADVSYTCTYRQHVGGPSGPDQIVTGLASCNLCDAFQSLCAKAKGAGIDEKLLVAPAAGCKEQSSTATGTSTAGN
jgi:hypothetical protein